MIPAATHGGRRLRRRLRPLVDRAGATPGADRYRKRFPATAHLWVLLFHVLDGAASLRQTHAKLAGDPRGWRRLGLPGGVSRSQLARSSTSRPSACAERLLREVVRAARRRAARDPLWRRPSKLQAVDSTFLALSAKLSPWSQHGRHAPGVRVQCGLDLAGAIPASLRLTLADTHAAAALKQRDLTGLRGWTVLIDLGYYGHKQFARLRGAGVHFLCRLHAQAAYRVVASRPVPAAPTADGDVVLADETIRLGSPNNRNGAVLRGVRLVTSRNPAGAVQRFVTDRFDLEAAEVVALYRKRWQIELFFRWLKHHLQAIHPLGTSRAAVWLTILLCAVAAVVAMLAEADRPGAVTRIAWVRGLAQALHPFLTDTS